jgi:hypothetical protein
MTALILALCLSQPPKPEFLLRRVAKAGQTFVMREAQVQVYKGQSARYDGKIEETVLKVDGRGGYILKTTRQGSSDALGNIPAETTLRYFNSKNELIRHESEISDAEQVTDRRKIALTGFRPPEKSVGIGSTWTYEVKIAMSGFEVRTKQTFTALALESVEGRRAMKVKLEATESGGGDCSSNVLLWVDVEDGSILQFDGTINKAPLVTNSVEAKIQIAARRMKDNP